MITGGDLRQSRLDVGYKTFTISPWEDGTISYDEILSLPRLSWAKDATLTLYGCNSGISGEARDLSIAELFSESQKLSFVAKKVMLIFQNLILNIKKYLLHLKRSIFGHIKEVKIQFLVMVLKSNHK